jgi:S1-C subfamily serine protease
LSLRALLLTSLLALPVAARADDARAAVARALAVSVTIEGGSVFGAGLLVDPPRGLVLTARHVIETMERPQVSFPDGAVAYAEVLDSDRRLDLALLKIAPQHRPRALLADAATLHPGDELYAVGCPHHLAFTVSRGIVSFVGRLLDGVRWLQSDLPINDGNSGGPVIDGGGRVVALMSFILRRGQGLSFALPINEALARFPQLAGEKLTSE